MREEKRELYREGTPDNLKKGYTDLVYGGSGVEVDKGVISASGSGGDGGDGGDSGGGALYGPYTAFVEAGEGSIPLASMNKTQLFTYTEYYDGNGDKVIFPEENAPVCSVITIEIYSSGLAMCALNMTAPLIDVINVTDSSISELMGAVTFYTDRPLEPAEA